MKINTGEQVDNLESLQSLSELKISIQNCNSLSLRCNEDIYSKKITAITSTGSDILFLSDIRLSDINCLIKVQHSLNANPNNSYRLIANSSKNSRGTAILVSWKLDIKVIEEYRDTEENILGLFCSIRGMDVLLISVYGPNFSEETFCTEIRRIILLHSNKPIIMGGDWNCVFDQNSLDENIDILNMATVPNQSNSKKLR